MMMDSVTRFAWRSGKSAWQSGSRPRATVYALGVRAAAKAARARGNGERGSITGLFTVLVEGDDMTEPVADAVRSILDGHVILARSLATRGHYPAVDVCRASVG